MSHNLIKTLSIITLITQSISIGAVEVKKDSFKITCESQEPSETYLFRWDEKARECFKISKLEMPKDVLAARAACEELLGSRDETFVWNSNRNNCEAIKVQNDGSKKIFAFDIEKCHSKMSNDFNYSWDTKSNACVESAKKSNQESPSKIIVSEDPIDKCRSANEKWIVEENDGRPGIKWDWRNGKCVNSRPGTLYAKVKGKYQEKKQERAQKKEERKKIEDIAKNNQYVPAKNNPSKNSYKTPEEYFSEGYDGYNGGEDVPASTTVRLPADVKKKEGVVKKSINTVKGFFSDRKERREAKNELIDERVCINRKEMGYKFIWNLNTKTCDKISSDPSYQELAKIGQKTLREKDLKEPCREYATVGKEDEYESCIKKITSHADPRVLEACKLTEDKNPDHYIVCINRISSDDKDINNFTKGCIERLGFGIRLVRCINEPVSEVVRMSNILIEDDGLMNLPLNKNVGFERELRTVNDVNLNSLKKCVANLENTSAISFRNDNEIIYRTSVNQNQKINPDNVGYILKTTNESYRFNDKDINVAFNKTCPDKTHCSFFSRIGSKFVEITVWRDDPHSMPNIIRIEKLVEKIPLRVSKNEFTPEKLDISMKDYISSQLSRSIAVAISDQFQNYQSDIEAEMSLTSEAYMQRKNTINSCIETMTLMAPDDKVVIEQSKYALDALNKLNDGSKRGIASRPKEQMQSTSAR